MNKLVAIAALAVSAPPLPVVAQVTPAIINDTQTTIEQAGNTFTITGGTQASSNLFHSFQQFGLDVGQIANFSTNPAIQNILGRVTGGDASVIYGQIQVTGSNANLYLMNPAGIVFGANASLNVPGSFTATTANGIGIGNHWFNATGPNNYAALAGTPNQFAFTTPQPGAIVNAGNLTVGQGQSITLLGGTVINTGTIAAPGGTVAIAAVPGEKLVRITQEGSLLSLDLPTATREALNPNTVRPLSLPALLTGGNLSDASGLVVESNGAGQQIIRLTSVDIPDDVATIYNSGAGGGSQPFILPNISQTEERGVVILSRPFSVSSELNSSLQVIGETIALIGAPITTTGTGVGGDITFTGYTTANNIEINTPGKVVFAGDLASSSYIEIQGRSIKAQNIQYGGCFDTVCAGDVTNVTLRATQGSIQINNIFLRGGFAPQSNNKTTLIAQNGDILTGSITAGSGGISVDALRFFRASGSFRVYTSRGSGIPALREGIVIKHGGESFQIDAGSIITLVNLGGTDPIDAQIPRPVFSVMGKETFDFVIGADLVIGQNSDGTVLLRNDVSGILGNTSINYPGNASAFVTTSNRPFRGNVYRPDSELKTTAEPIEQAREQVLRQSNELPQQLEQFEQFEQSEQRGQQLSCYTSTTIAAAAETRSLNGPNPCASTGDDSQILKLLEGGVK
jgi:filamentous hemagglutinin family protein